MERKLVDVGHRVEAPTDAGLVSDITHSAGAGPATERSAGSGGMDGDALHSLRRAATAVGNGVQDRRDEVVAYARKEPLAALTVAAGLGFLVGLTVAIASRGGSAAERSWLPGWRRLLRLD
jgi:hypothetical protein